MGSGRSAERIACSAQTTSVFGQRGRCTSLYEIIKSDVEMPSACAISNRMAWGASSSMSARSDGYEDNRARKPQSPSWSSREPAPARVARASFLPAGALSPFRSRGKTANPGEVMLRRGNNGDACQGGEPKAVWEIIGFA